MFDDENFTETSQEQIKAVGEKFVAPKMDSLALKAAQESIILLKNKKVLPLNAKESVALFGRCQIDSFFVGYGSGGDSQAPYKITILDAILEAGYALDKTFVKAYQTWCSQNKVGQFDWGKWPRSLEEMPLSEAQIKEAAKKSETAIFVIGRSSGEDRESLLKEGSYYLTQTEKDILKSLRANFKKLVVLLNVGSLIDMSCFDCADALLIVWQLGMQMGRAVANVLWGKANPCGRLAQSIAKAYEDYPSSSNFGNDDFNNYQEDIFVGYRYFETFAPEKVLYPFGYGLGYTRFALRPKSIEPTNNGFECKVLVTNIGKVTGKEVVQLYLNAPDKKLGKPSRTLLSFVKTRPIAPAKSQLVKLYFDFDSLASFDDKKSQYVVEEGEYRLFLGSDVRSAKQAFAFNLEPDLVLDTLKPICKVQQSFERMVKVEGKLEYEAVPISNYDLKERIVSSLPKELSKEISTTKFAQTNYNFKDVLNKKISLDEFICSLSDEELEALSRGQGGMNAPQGIAGNAGVFGAVIDSLVEKDVPVIVTADGPSGLRVERFTSLLPIGSALASTWNTKLVQNLYQQVGEELKNYKVDVLLGPGMNIIRNPLCGRNFEYYSEDPFLTGKMAVSFVKGLKQANKIACPKHFCCNNQEHRRIYHDSRVSERALREIYLKGFEICVREAKPLCIMTSYNKINGVYAHYNYDTCQVVLRDEWGFDGVVMTDWWMRHQQSPEFEGLKDNAYRVRSSVDVLMPGGWVYEEREYKSDNTLLGSITKAELQRTAKRVLKLCREVICTSKH